MIDELTAYLVGGVVVFWIQTWVIGPLRLLMLGMQGHSVVNFPQLPVRKRREQWEIWMMIPMIAYILSWISGVSVSLLFSRFSALSLLVLSAGMVLLFYVGLFFGMRDFSGDEGLSEIDDPSAFWAELKSRKDNGILSKADIEDAQAHVGQLEPDSEPAWRKRIREEISEEVEKRKAELNSSCAPRLRGLGTWRDGNGKRITISLAMRWREWRHHWTIWLNLAVAAVCILVIVSFAIHQYQVGEYTLTPGNMARLSMVLLPLAVTVLTTHVGVRTYLIYQIRLYLAEREQVKKINDLIIESENAHKEREEARERAREEAREKARIALEERRSHQTLKDREAQALVLRKTARAPVHNVSLFQEIIEVLHRRYC